MVFRLSASRLLVVLEMNTKGGFGMFRPRRGCLVGVDWTYERVNMVLESARPQSPPGTMRKFLKDERRHSGRGLRHTVYGKVSSSSEGFPACRLGKGDVRWGMLNYTG